jgi:fatty acid desaturase
LEREHHAEALLRASTRRALPEEAFRRQPLRALWFLPLVLFEIGAVAAIVGFDLSWPVDLTIALCLGNALAATLFLAHEAMHGALVCSPVLQYFLGALGLGPFLISPGLWRVWHNRFHHNHANDPERDPDVFGTIELYEERPSTRFVARLAPGSRSWPSYFCFLYWFAFHGQLVLWFQSRTWPHVGGFSRTRAQLESAFAAVAVAALAIHAGAADALFAVVIPLCTANLIAMSYIATNHLLRPQLAAAPSPLVSMGVRTWRLVDRLHFCFSHHVEHHMFPRMSGRFLPVVRRVLERELGDQYVAPAHHRAIAWLYRTPRIHRDAYTLSDPRDRSRPDVDVRALQGVLARTGSAQPGHRIVRSVIA